MQFNNIFDDEYTFSLKDISYTRIDTSDTEKDLEISVNDGITANADGNQLEVSFERKVSFKPKALYELSVVFTCTLSFRDDSCQEKYKHTNWEQEFLAEQSPYLTNMTSRASSLISAITASYGQMPLITPPTFIK